MPPQLQLTLDENFETGVLDPQLWSIGEPWDKAPGAQLGPDGFLPIPTPLGLVEVSGGTLKIRAKNAVRANSKVDCGFVTTRGKFDFLHGYLETQVKLPSAAGLWPAFWLLGNGTGTMSWPRCGEIDIFEILQAVAPGVPFRTDHWADPVTNNHTQHTVGDSPGEAYPKPITNYAGRWVKFGLLRTIDKLVTYIDDQPMYTTLRTTKNADGKTPGPVVFDTPMHVRFDMQAGKWGEKAPLVQPGQLEVQYLRAWTF